MPQNLSSSEGKGWSSALSILEGSLPTSTFTLLMAIADKASAIDMPLFLVGGSVRDMILHGESLCSDHDSAVQSKDALVKDLDMVVEGNAALLAFEVAKELSGEVLTYSQFGTATVKVEGQRFDLATARQETYRRPGALPDVTPSSIHADLGRRDFSINAMAIALSGPQMGHIFDRHKGTQDLKLGLIRILHPRSFVDDATRILRAIRYEQRLHFDLEEGTHKLLLEAVEGGMLNTVSGDRIRRELELMLQEKHPHLLLSRCGDLGILRAIYPPLGDGSCVKALEGPSGQDDPLAYLAALSFPLTSQEGEAFIHRLRMPSRWAKIVRDTVAVQMKSGADPTNRPYIGEPGLSPGQLCSFLDQLSPTSIQVYACLSQSRPVRDSLKLYLSEMRHVTPFLSGRDIISLGATQGPLVGEILRELKNARIEGRISTGEEEIQVANEYILTKGG